MRPPKTDSRFLRYSCHIHGTGWPTVAAPGAIGDGDTTEFGGIAIAGAGAGAAVTLGGAGVASLADGALGAGGAKIEV